LQILESWPGPYEVKMSEKCNCSQSVFYRELSRDLAKKVLNYCTGNQEKYGSIGYLAEVIVPAARLVLEKTDRRIHNGS